MSRITFLSFLIFITLTGVQGQIRFEDLSKEAGLSVPHVAAKDYRYIVESMSGGVAVFDCDDDGRLDIATANGSSVENYRKGGDNFVTLYRRVSDNKSTRFQDITSDAGIAKRGWGMGVTAVDYDGDSKLDLFVTGFEGNAVFRGLGNCKFEDTTKQSGLGGSGFMTGSAWADYDRDGDLDVFVAGYVKLDMNKLPVFGSAKNCSYRGIRVQCGPRGLPGERDFLFRNEGDGTFKEVSKLVGVYDEEEYFGLGVVWTDLDDDGWLDLFVANDSTPNYYYRNKKDGTFEDLSFESGLSYSGDGGEQSSMGVSIEDYDTDGDLDIFLTHFETEYNTLYKNLGKNSFIDYSAESSVSVPSKPFVGWGTGFFDFDNDEILDLIVVNGHVYPQMELVKSKGVFGFNQPMLLHRGVGSGKFVDVTKGSGLEKLPLKSRRGAAFADLNEDGLIDIVVTNLGNPPTLLINRTKTENNGLFVQLKQDGANGNAIGARISFDAGKTFKEVKAGESYLSQNDLALHISTGKKGSVDDVEIRWPDGKIEKIGKLSAGNKYLVRKNKGVIKSTQFKD